MLVLDVQRFDSRQVLTTYPQTPLRQPLTRPVRVISWIALAPSLGSLNLMYTTLMSLPN